MIGNQFSLIRVFGLLKLVFYKLAYPSSLSFSHTVVFHPMASILIDRKSKITFGEHVTIERGVVFSVKDGCMNVGDKSMFRRDSFFEVSGGGCLNIGNQVFINRCAQVVCLGEINLGNNIAIGTHFSMFDHDHEYHADCMQEWWKIKTGSINIRDQVWIGANVILLRGTEICKNSVVGAGVVLKAGVPANTLIVLDRKSNISKPIPRARDKGA